MKRSDLYIRIVSGVLFLAVASFIGFSVYDALINPFETMRAVSYTIEETLPAHGFIVRTETVLTETGAAVLPVVREGVKVASGQAVAVEYLTRDSLETASELRSLRLRIAQLEAAGNVSDSARLESVMDLSRAVHSGDLSRLDELSLLIETNIFETSAGAPELDELLSRLEVLEQRSAGMRTIHAPVSGTFSLVTDGFEHISPGMLTGLSPTGLSELFQNPLVTAATGKLVTEFKWYYAAVLSAEDAARLMVNRRMPVRFSGAFHAAMDMIVESIGRAEGGFSVVLFSSDRSIHEITAQRELRAEIVYEVVTGIRVPMTAIRLDDDAVPHVFIQAGARAERVDIERLRDYGDSWIVRDGALTGSSLRSGSTIIVRANNLFDGKVVA